MTASPPLATRFDPKTIDRRWQTVWQEAGYFRAPERPRGDRYCIPQPPPNVTGILTLGHMLGDTVRDVLARWHRMRGEAVLWFPGVDHAGVSTQVEVRRRLSKEGVRFESLSREEARQRLEDWKREHENRIREQFAAGGFSADWTRYRYTMDPGMARATRVAFVQLYHEGLIYRGERIVNWDPKLRTALSDLEVLHEEESVDLLYVRYYLEGPEGGELLVATVRPETIFGDVAVAVHPDDERHRSLIGRRVRVPLTDRVVPIIADTGVDREFGNGALKVTPRHDLLDFEIAQRHPELTRPPETFDEEARLTGPWVPDRYQGLSREEARTKATEELVASGLITQREPIRHSVGHSERTGAVIEPRLSEQWFVKMASLAQPAVDAVRSGEIRIHPERWELTFFRWMERIQDWCISRQVLWGHPIPVYYCEECGEATATVDTPTKCPRCSSSRLRPDPDVLDTWFTSWMWPFAGLGWPEQTADLASYYPANVLVTAREIMFFWVARMMMAGYKFLGRRPFDQVYFTGLLRDDTGRKMSKHLGNSPDPLEMIGEWGADALRWAMVHHTPTDQDGPFGTKALEQARNFLTKLWNITRFAQGRLPPGANAPTAGPKLSSQSALENRWVLSRYRHTVELVSSHLEAFEFTQAAEAIYQFLWLEVADQYIELAKDAIDGNRGELAARESRAVLSFILERSLRLVHPIAPHVTEELWHAIPHDGDSLVITKWPGSAEVAADEEAEVEMNVVLEAVRLFRNLRAENRLPPAYLPDAFVRPRGAEAQEVFGVRSESISRLAKLRSLQILPSGSPAPPNTLRAVSESAECFLVRPAEARASTDSLEREREKLTALLAKSRARLSDPGFRSRAPAELIAQTEVKAVELEERLRRIDEHLGAQPAPEASS